VRVYCDAVFSESWGAKSSVEGGEGRRGMRGVKRRAAEWEVGERMGQRKCHVGCLWAVSRAGPESQVTHLK
jgi:hypothetical protein